MLQIATAPHRTLHRTAPCTVPHCTVSYRTAPHLLRKAFERAHPCLLQSLESISISRAVVVCRLDSQSLQPPHLFPDLRVCAALPCEFVCGCGEANDSAVRCGADKGKWRYGAVQYSTVRCGAVDVWWCATSIGFKRAAIRNGAQLTVLVAAVCWCCWSSCLGVMRFLSYIARRCLEDYARRYAACFVVSVLSCLVWS